MNDLIAACVLSGNRNFEARVHQSIKANFLMSPPLVVAFALAGTRRYRSVARASGQGSDGEDVYLRDIWPTMEEIGALMQRGLRPGNLPPTLQQFRRSESACGTRSRPAPGMSIEWDPESTYIQEPPFFEGFGTEVGQMEDIHGRAAAGDLRRFSDDRSHQSRRRDQSHFTRRRLSAAEGRRRRGLQQLRLAARQS